MKELQDSRGRGRDPCASRRAVSGIKKERTEVGVGVGVGVVGCRCGAWIANEARKLNFPLVSNGSKWLLRFLFALFPAFKSRHSFPSQQSLSCFTKSPIVFIVTLNYKFILLIF